MLWSEDQIEQVRSLAAQGQSAAMIANEVGATRNAVVGIGHRKSITFKGRSGGYRPPKSKPQIELPTIDAQPEPEYVGVITIMELTAATCRFPIGDPRQPDFRYCGKWKSAATSYCNACFRIVYETPEQRRARLRQ